jgi:hypothetical protein
MFLDDFALGSLLYEYVADQKRAGAEAEIAFDALSHPAQDEELDGLPPHLGAPT